MRKTLFLTLTERLEQVVWIDGVPTFEPDAAKREGCRRVFRHFDLNPVHINQYFLLAEPFLWFWKIELAKGGIIFVSRTNQFTA